MLGQIAQLQPHDAVKKCLNHDAVKNIYYSKGLHKRIEKIFKK